MQPQKVGPAPPSAEKLQTLATDLNDLLRVLGCRLSEFTALLLSPRNIVSLRYLVNIDWLWRSTQTSAALLIPPLENKYLLDLNDLKFANYLPKYFMFNTSTQAVLCLIALSVLHLHPTNHQEALNFPHLPHHLLLIVFYSRKTMLKAEKWSSLTTYLTN